MKSGKKLLQTLGIIIGAILCIGYNYVFIRNDQGHRSLKHTIGDRINKVPYTEHFYISQAQPNVFFTAPAFPVYTERCHNNKKFCSILPMQQMYADSQWIGSIQFVGAQGNPNELLGLSKLLDGLTNLAPYWDYPYAFSQLLVPMPRAFSQKVSESIVNQSREDAKELADRGEYYLCDPAKIATIKGLSESGFINTVYNTGARDPLKNPCPTYERAHYAGFNAYYFRRQAEESANNYRISSFTTGSPGLAPIMAALAYGRGGEHIKSASLRYDRYLVLREQEQNEVTAPETNRTFRKAVFELQLQLITDADNMSEKVCKNSYECLVKNGHIKKSILNSYNTICEGGKNVHNMRCILLYAGLQNKRIGLDGKLIYPVDDVMKFARSDTYESRWILPKE